MEPDAAGQPAITRSDAVPSDTCPVCHQLVLPQYYFCPNCGANLHPAPLSTSPATQALMYAHSVILPMLLFITITKWQGYKYYKSQDPKVKQIGTAAIVILILSTFITFYLAYVWTMDAVQSSLDSVNADMSM